MEFITETQAIKQSLTFICLLEKINLKAIFSNKKHASYFLTYPKLVNSTKLLHKIAADKNGTFAQNLGSRTECGCLVRLSEQGLMS